jgi:hypothetical protein
VDFAQNNFLQSKVVSLSSTPNTEEQFFIFMSVNEGVGVLPPDIVFIPLCDTQGYGRKILARIHTGQFCSYA